MKLDRIPHIYHNTIYAKKIFEIIEDKHIRIRNMFNELSSFNDIKKSSGFLLDILGKNFKIERLNRNDDEYRKIIAFEITAVQFIGSIEELINILATYFDEDINNFSITELSGKIRLIIPDTVNKDVVIRLVKRIKSAGVGLNVDFEIYIEDYLISELERKTLNEISKIKLARR
ncbi:MAG: hypothetical protein SOY60_07000 [Fusobacterium gastrosuis]|uniref:hypothetical protein n=1 Tax=Fusobacterium gastrosuis TaxID=1755100 RepID=UPI002A8D3E63|nr:hypothetical protein [Fusobacterium gastrosuis]